MTPPPWSERDRLAFLERRDGAEAAAKWAWRTLRIYRRALLTPRHFARAPEYRRRFVQAYCEFKRWLARAGGQP
ncbi:MAG: hypothetical protein IT514_13520 [Burkholderiales bacterium]|nr:hypothetical protein [Burkholderiales bacterium]